MNNTRRKALAVIHNELEDLAERLEEIIAEEQEALDNIPESFQGSDRYQSAEEAISNLEEALDNLGSAYEQIEEIINA